MCFGGEGKEAGKGVWPGSRESLATVCLWHCTHLSVPIGILLMGCCSLSHRLDWWYLMSKVQGEENVMFISWEPIPSRVGRCIGEGSFGWRTLAQPQSVRQPSRAVLLCANWDRLQQWVLTPTTWSWVTLHKLRPPSTTTTSLGPQGHLHFWPISYKFRSSHYLFQFSNSQEWLRTQESAILKITVSLQQKDTNQNQPKEETYRTRSEKMTSTKLLVSLPCGLTVGYPTSPSLCDNMQSLANQGGSPELCCSEFLLGFHYLAGLIESWVPWLNFIFSYPHLPRCQVDITWLKAPTL